MQAPTCSASLRSATASTRFAQVPLVALQRLGAARDCPLHLVRLVPYLAGLGFATATFGIRREDTACHHRHARHVEGCDIFGCAGAADFCRGVGRHSVTPAFSISLGHLVQCRGYILTAMARIPCPDRLRGVGGSSVTTRGVAPLVGEHRGTAYPITRRSLKLVARVPRTVLPHTRNTHAWT